MTMRKALLLGSEASLKSLERPLATQSFEIKRPAKTEWRDVLKLTSRCDLLLIDLDMPHISGLEMLEQLQKRVEVPVMFIGDNDRLKQYEKELEPLLAQVGVDWISRPVCEAEVRLRVKKVAARIAPAIVTWNVPELRSDRTGRLDATLVAEHFGWKLTELSNALGRSVQAVHKTPDARGLQKGLEKLERAALLARRLVSDKASDLRKWLNTPSPDLDEEKPGKLLLEKPDVVVQWLEDAASGQPA